LLQVQQGYPLAMLDQPSENTSSDVNIDNETESAASLTNNVTDTQTQIFATLEDMAQHNIHNYSVEAASPGPDVAQRERELISVNQSSKLTDKSQPSFSSFSQSVDLQWRSTAPIFDFNNRKVKRFVLVANNPHTDLNAPCMPTESLDSMVIIRFNHMEKLNDTFHGKTDIEALRVTGGTDYERNHYAIWADRARNLPLKRPPRVLAIISEKMASFSGAQRTLASKKIRWDGVLYVGNDWASSGFAVLLWVTRNYPGVPVTLLGFNSHEEQPQSPDLQNGFFHSFGEERAAIDSMADIGVERCGVD